MVDCVSVAGGAGYYHYQSMPIPGESLFMFPHSGKSFSHRGDELWCPQFPLVVVVVAVVIAVVVLVVILGTENIRRLVFCDAYRQCAMLALPPSFFSWIHLSSNPNHWEITCLERIPRP